MKVILSLAFLLAATTTMALPVDKDALEKEIFDFAPLIPIEDILNIIAVYNKNDVEFQNLSKYLSSENFRTFFAAFERAPETYDFIDYLDESGMKIYKYVNVLNDIIGIDHLEPREKRIQRDIEITGGLEGLIKDLKAVVSFRDFRLLHEHKVKYSPIYAAFVRRLLAPEFAAVSNNTLASEAFRTLFRDAMEAEVNVLILKRLFCTIFGLLVCTN